MPLHINCRPTELKQMIGNASTVAAVEAILGRKNKDFPHAWLFTGPSGCGKTTLARIVARRLGIADADLKELNIANTRGIDNARDIQDQMRLRALGAGGSRGWILDECHMGTKEFWNAMLKPLEDTPAHVFFFLCTTDPQKLLKTVTGRCEAARFAMESLGKHDLTALVKATLSAEGVNIPGEVRDQVVASADGSARAALGILDKIIDMPAADMMAAAKQVTDEQVEAIALCRALIKGEKWPVVAKIIKGMGEFDAENVRQAVLGYCNAILLKEDNNRAWLVYDSFRDPLDRNGRSAITYQAYMAVLAK